jgi:3-hydroxyethyl bacteriochlorophyllide a dehydrogenase
VRARAVVFPEAGRVELRDVTLREPAADEVVVETGFSSISSGTERLLFDGKLPGMPHLRYPLVPGYEAVGTVLSAGPDVRGVSVGDQVFVGGSMCYTDVAAAFGGQSSRLVKRAAQVVPLFGIAPAQAPLLALAATALHGVRRLGDVSGARVAVLGLGAVGQLAAAFLKAGGAQVIVADRSRERLASAVADEAYDVSETALEALLSAPVAHAIEATGNPAEIARCARIMAPGGTIVLLSYYDVLSTAFPDLFVKEATLLVSREWAPADLLAARDLAASGAVDLAPLAGHVVPIERYEDAYRTAFGDPAILKVVLQWA